VRLNQVLKKEDASTRKRVKKENFLKKPASPASQGKKIRLKKTSPSKRIIDYRPASPAAKKVLAEKKYVRRCS